MKKYGPIVILFLGILVAIGAFFVLKGKNGQNSPIDDQNQEETVPEIAFEKRPAVSLTPSADGHWLKLEIQKIVINAATLDYELTYKVPDGRTQGVPGTVKLENSDNIVKDLLLGSESSGKYRYDDGVENGNLTLTFRDQKGKSVAKFSTDFFLQTAKEELHFSGGQTYKIDKLNNKTFYISMGTIGYPGSLPSSPTESYGIFSSSLKGNSGILDGLDAYLWYKGEWIKMENGKSPDVGFFIIN